MRVTGISTNVGWPPGAIILNADDYARASDNAAPSALQIEIDCGASPNRVTAAFARTLSPQLPTRVQTRRQGTELHYAASRDGLSRLTQISILVLVSAMIAMAAAMGGMIWQRRPSLAGLKVHSFPEPELWRALLLESALLLGTGCLIGAVFALYGQSSSAVRCKQSQVSPSPTPPPVSSRSRSRTRDRRRHARHPRLPRRPRTTRTRRGGALAFSQGPHQAGAEGPSPACRASAPTSHRGLAAHRRRGYPERPAEDHADLASRAPSDSRSRPGSLASASAIR